MKTFFLYIFTFLLFLLPSLTFAQENWNIQEFQEQITLQKNGSFIVEETIFIDFSREPHHGIYRTIPVKYSHKGQVYNLNIKILEITNENGKPWPYQITHPGNNLEIKIGDEQRELFREIKTFKIKYVVNRGLLYFDDHTELYWNVTGNEWPVKIENTQATIILPETVAEKNIQTSCYTGIFGSNEQNCTTDITQNKQIIFSTKNGLQSGEGLTIVVGVPPNIINEPSIFKKIYWFFKDNFLYLIPLLLLIFLYRHWHTHGRDPEKNAIMPRFELPENLTASEIGTVIDEKADISDISAAIIELAVKGYLKIDEIESKKLFFDSTDYVFTKLKEPDDSLKTHEKLILNEIFGNMPVKQLSDLKNKFYKKLPLIKSAIYQEVTKNSIFKANPDKIRKIYFGIGGGLIGITLMFSQFLSFFSIYGFQIIVSSIISGALILVFGKYMPQKTKEGMQTYEHILGLKMYIETAERDRLEFQEKEKIFEKFLGAAMVLGVADKWAKAFEDILKTPPNWYTGPSGGQFIPHLFINDLNRMAKANSQCFTSAPSQKKGAFGGFSGLGGGGFSGGGFGGGGGRAF